MAASSVSRPYLSNSSSSRRAAEAAGGHLRFHVAQRGLRKADVVLDDAVERVVELAFLVDLELVELQPFQPRIGDRRASAETGRGAADVDPVRAHHQEHQQLALVEVGHVDDDVVEMLARHRLMVGDDDVAGLEAVLAVALQPVDHEHAEVRDEVRHAADVLRDQFAPGAEQRRAVVAHLVDHHVVGGALQVGRHLVGDGRQRVADHFQRDGVEVGGHERRPWSRFLLLPRAPLCSLPRLRGRVGEGAAVEFGICGWPPPCPSPVNGGGDGQISVACIANVIARLRSSRSVRRMERPSCGHSRTAPWSCRAPG